MQPTRRSPHVAIVGSEAPILLSTLDMTLTGRLYDLGRDQGDWRQQKGRLKEKWGELTDDDLDRIDGKRDQLLGVLQNRYGRAKDVAEREVREFEDSLRSVTTM